ncbi:MAG: gluconate 2-dehydrogenase subunit 3 family protein [Candidatus Korobacteraceae bacterium]
MELDNKFEPRTLDMPETSQGVTRRSFLAGSVAGVWLAANWPQILAAQTHAHRAAATGRPTKLEFLSPEQSREVEAMAAQIIPADDTPGAREAKVVYFIDRALTTFARDNQDVYTKGLGELQSKTREMFPGTSAFSALSSQQQIQLLTAIEKTQFFAQVRLHTILGFFADPVYGGNQEKVGWKLIGFEDKFAYATPFGYYDRDYKPS